MVQTLLHTWICIPVASPQDPKKILEIFLRSQCCCKECLETLHIYIVLAATSFFESNKMPESVNVTLTGSLIAMMSGFTVSAGSIA